MTFSIILSGNRIQVNSVKWSLYENIKYFTVGYIVNFNERNLFTPELFDGNFALITLHKELLTIYTDFWGTKPIFLSVNDVIIVSNNHIICDKNYIIVDRRTKLCLNIKSGEMTTEKYINLQNNVKYTSDHVYNHLCELIESIKLNNIGLSLSEGYDSGVIAALLLKKNKDVSVSMIDLKHRSDIIEQRSSLFSRCSVFAPSKTDDINYYNRYLTKPGHITLNDSYECDYTKSWGSIGLCMILERLRAAHVSTCLTGIGADALFLPHIKEFYNTPYTKKMPYPYNEALDIHNSCIKANCISAMFNIDFIYIFLFKSVWEIVMNLTEESLQSYKQPFQYILEREKFPYYFHSSIETKVGLERS